MNLLIIHDVRGREWLAPIIKCTFIENSVDYIVLLGNIVSPSILMKLFSFTSNVLGVLGNLDDRSVAAVLSRRDALLDNRVKDIGGYRVLGIGASPAQLVSVSEKVNLVLSFYPGYEHTCCERYLKTVDEVVEKTRPDLIITGKCREPCTRDRITCPGLGYLGYAAIVDLSTRDVVPVNLYEYIWGRATR